MWGLLWLGFVVVFVAGPLLLVAWRRHTARDVTGPLPNPRGRRRPAPDVVEAEERMLARLRLVALAAAPIAAIWLVVGLSR